MNIMIMLVKTYLLKFDLVEKYLGFISYNF